MTLNLRSAEPADAERLLAIYRPWVEAPGYCFELACPDREAFADRIASARAHWDWCLAEDAGEVLGYAYAGPHRERAAYRYSCEVSVYLAPVAQGQGLAQALYGRLLPRLAARGYFNALAVIVQPNPRSLAFHQREGFRPVGVFERAGYKHDRWWDVAWLQKRLRDGAPRVEPGILDPSFA
ncbi:MAG: GNAT family N-acetyltransferase [Aquimonas sp.]|jgi:L-amino acid N-acyltransferase YncA